jgi:hypothetical protein
MIVAVDFDGVICKRTGVIRESDFSDDLPVKEARDAIEWLFDQGHLVYILTARPKEEWEDIIVWLQKHNFVYAEVTNVKKLGTKVIIDDRAIRFTNWVDVCKYFG